MPNIAVMVKVDEAMGPLLHAAEDKLSGEVSEVLVDMSAVRRVNASAVGALQAFLELAEVRGIRVGLRGVHVEVYKVLKLVKLASRLTFVNWDDGTPGQES